MINNAVAYHKAVPAQAKLEIRQARPTDGGKANSHDLVALMYSAGPQLYDFVYQTARHSALDYIAYEFQSGRGFCGYPNVTVVVDNGTVVGTGCFYDAKQYGRLTRGTLLNMFKFYGWIDVWPVLLRSSHIQSVMKRPRPGEIYLSNFGVAASRRSAGIGSAMIKHKVAEAAAAGYQSFALDVADNNPRAERLYKRLGLCVVAVKKFTGKRAGMLIPNAKKMVLNLPTHKGLGA